MYLIIFKIATNFIVKFFQRSKIPLANIFNNSRTILFFENKHVKIFEVNIFYIMDKSLLRFGVEKDPRLLNKIFINFWQFSLISKGSV